MRATRINRGITSETPLSDVPPDDRQEVIGWRKAVTTRQIPLDCKSLIYYVEDGEATENWAGYGTKEAYLRDGLGIDPLTVTWAIEGLKIYKGDTSKLSVQEAADLGRPSNILAAAPTLAPHGANQHRRGGDNVTSSNETKRGNDSGYLAARIKRDRPDIAERIDEYPSIYAAAVDAGIVKLKSNLRKLHDLWKKTSEEERGQFLQEIGAKLLHSSQAP